jgi:hypothetical protein
MVGMRSRRRRLAVARRRRLVASAVVLALAVILPAGATFSAFTSTGAASAANTTTAGSVAITDNDANGAMFSMTGMTPGSTDTACITVTYTGSLPSQVRLYGTTTGTGLDAYLDVVVTRGTIAAPTFDSCTGFTPDTPNYGNGAGIVYTGTLAGYADSWAAGTLDPRTALLQEVWTTGESHAYRFDVTLQNNPAAANKTASQTFSWEARNTTAYSEVVLSDQPASYWKLDEAAGTTATDTMGAANGTYTNSPTLNQASGVKDANNAVSFDAANDFVTMGDVHDFAGTASFSTEFWMRSNTGNEEDYRRVVAKERYGSATSRGGWGFTLYPLSHTDSNRIYFQRWDGAAGGNSAKSTTSLQPGTWYHIVGTYDGTNMRLYVNGVLERTTASSISVENHTSGLRFGRGDTCGCYGGLIDEVAVYGTALTATQVLDHYNAGKR